ncbi:hypothetical protein J1N35_011610, partial [Gossypium stocksii]
IANVPLTNAEDITPNKCGRIRIIFAKLRGIGIALTTQQSQTFTTTFVPIASPLITRGSFD